ncbi:sialate O-acetylesterase [Pelagicoccus albus]|uniref:Sialate O-acetylesterase domain-containing protein n=1 Tax=Pelagicoccus albus TaxID=415222 RepID=A0A7X1B434_9BACT|nr:sialate O-acetylesterase [Pelagicoccus albus]MBC2605232.1 hypothetical protein [Pelagicoccus albus]
MRIRNSQKTSRSDLGRDKSPHTRRLARAILPTLLLSLAPLTQADITCPPIFTDHMVLQREMPVKLWGTADPGENVTAQFSEQVVSTTADESGNWSLALAPLKASASPRSLSLTGNNELIFDDVLVGEVWFCSGQSNMDKPLGEQKGQKPTLGYPEVLKDADLPHLRLFVMPRHGVVKNEENQMLWKRCSPETVESMRFSAAGFHFGEKLHAELDVPIGLIHCAYGGTMIEAWMPDQAFQHDEELAPLLDQPYFAWVKGVQATELYESMVEPLAPFSLRGFLWYQGEANLMHGDGSIYADKMRALIKSWRDAWSDSEAPFYFAQIAPFTYSEWIGDKTPSLDALPYFWETQASVVDAENGIEMIPTFDLVKNVRDIHPVNKRDVGYRFANLALESTYSRPGDKSEIPQLISTIIQGKKRLKASFTQKLKESQNIAAGELGAFEIAGKDAVYYPAEVKWRGANAILSSEFVEKPIYTRYAWDEKAQAPYTGSDKLPLYPFRTDKKKIETLLPQFHKAERIQFTDPGADDYRELKGNEDQSFELEGCVITLSKLSEDSFTLTISGLSENPHTIAVQQRGKDISFQQFFTQKGFTLQKVIEGSIADLVEIVIDAPDPSKQANSPLPQTGATTQTTEDGGLTLSWQPGQKGDTYILYLNFGDELSSTQEKVLKAGRSSSTWQGLLNQNSFEVTDPKTGYYTWRVDSISKAGELTRGDVWTFKHSN